MVGGEDTTSMDSLADNGRLFKIGVVYFALFLAHSIWRITLHNNAANNFGLSESQIGYVLSATYIPGIFAFSIGLVARELQLYKLIVFAALALAVGMFLVSSTVELAVLVFSALLIAFGFTFFYTVANSACLLSSEGDRASYDLGRLKSLGPLAGFFAAIIVLFLFAPAVWTQWSSLLDLSNPIGTLEELIAKTQSAPEVDARILRDLLVTLSVLLVLLGIYVSYGIRLSRVGRTYGRFNIRRKLLPYYVLNFLAGCRSGIFQTFALFVMVKHYHLPVSGTAILVMTAHMCSFLGYRWVGMMLRRFSHGLVLTFIYAVVALNFVGFWVLTSGAFDLGQGAVLGLGGLFLIDSFFFGASVVTDSHLKSTSEPRDFIGDIGAGMTMFSVAAGLMSVVGSLLWEPLGSKAFLLGTMICLLAMVLSHVAMGSRKAVVKT